MKGARKHQSIIVGMVTLLATYSMENSIRRKCESELNCWKLWGDEDKEEGRKRCEIFHARWRTLKCQFSILCVSRECFCDDLKLIWKHMCVRPLSPLTSWISWQLSTLFATNFCVFILFQNSLKNYHKVLTQQTRVVRSSCNFNVKIIPNYCCSLEAVKILKWT